MESVFEARERALLKSEEDGDGGVPRAGDSEVQMEFRGARLRAPTPEHVSGDPLGGGRGVRATADDATCHCKSAIHTTEPRLLPALF